MGVGNVIERLFGLPASCNESSAVEVAQADGTPGKMMSVKGLIMNEYQKAEGLVAYLRSVSPSAPKHVVFYDDFVTNPVSFARYFCSEGTWEGLEQVTAVWFATPEAEIRDKRYEEAMRRGEFDAQMHSESSFFSPRPDNDADLAPARSL